MPGIRAMLCLMVALVPSAVAAQQVVSRPIPRGVVVAANVERYPVTGSTIEEISASLRQSGTLGHFSVSWRYNYQPTTASGKAGCRLVNVRVDMQTRIRVPEWSVSGDATPELAKAWETFAAANENHVREHENIAIRNAGDLVNRLERMTDMSCRQLQLDVQREARSATDRLQQRQQKLDADTEHGAKQGVKWPPGSGR